VTELLRRPGGAPLLTAAGVAHAVAVGALACMLAGDNSRGGGGGGASVNPKP